MKDKLFIQIPYEDLLDKLWLIALFRVNPEIYIKPKLIASYNDADIDKIRAVFAKRKLSRTVHAPIYDPYKETFDIFRESYSKTSRFCKRLSIATIVMHVEYDEAKRPSLEAWLKEVIGIWRWIADAASRDCMTVLVENHNEASPDSVIRILKEVDSSNLKACFDVGHFNAFSKKGAIACLDDYPDGSIEEIHLSDNLGDGDTHLALGRGNIDFVNFFKAADKRFPDIAYTIEAKDIWGVFGGMRYLKRIGRL